ncbi:MAG: hypothetical protein COB37_11575 [Kordiimonadales bacterium]|nr:MAG: hypothetical protein COB37_11575 [Kordiimonadales bacterium]
MLTKLAAQFTSLLRQPRRPKKKLFIHAGTFKTGTSFFQHVMYHNREKLLDAGICYPDTGLGLKTTHNQYAHRILGIHLVNGSKNHFPAIIDELNQNTALSQAIVSYEGFCQFQALEKLRDSRQCFKTVDLHGILVFRPHVDYALSLYRELSQRVSFKPSFQDFVSPGQHIGKPWKRTLRYAEIVTLWQGLVGKKRVHVKSYNSIKHDVVSEILGVIGFDTPLPRPSSVTRNVTLSAPCAALMRNINQEKIKEQTRSAFARELLEIDAQFPEFQDYCEITQDEAKILERQYETDRNFFDSQGLIPKNELLLGDNWRWGHNSDIEPAQRQAQAILLQQLQQKEYTSLLDIAKRAFQ